MFMGQAWREQSSPFMSHCLEPAQSHSHTSLQRRLGREIGSLSGENRTWGLALVTQYLFALFCSHLEYTHPLLKEEIQLSHLIGFKVWDLVNISLSGPDVPPLVRQFLSPTWLSSSLL